jgi:hypothetical protein
MAEHIFSPDEMYKFIFRISRSKMKILIGIFVLGFILILFREQGLLLLGGFLIVKDTVEPANIIHVIAGDDYRTNFAIQLYK